MMFPSLFISHGAPNVILQDSLTKRNIKNFSNNLKKPRYIIIFSAHYTTRDLKIINYEANELMYDFYGFERELYEFKYPIKSDKKITLEMLEFFNSHEIDIKLDTNRKSYDHGVWSVLSMMYEYLDVPVIELSLPLNYSYEALINLGEILKAFKEEAMIITSGGVTHNLRDMERTKKIKDYAKTFNELIVDAVTQGDTNKLIEATNKEIFYQNHPTSEHFLPLLIAFGSAKNKRGFSFSSEMFYSNISMESFAFDTKG